MPLTSEHLQVPVSLHARPRLRWALIAAATLLLIFLSLVVVGVRHWPFTRAALQQSLEQQTHSHVQFTSFHQTYFPHPGCVAEQVTLERPSGPRVTIRRLIVNGSYAGLLHHYVPQLRAEGAQLSIAAGDLRQLALPRGTNSNHVSIGELNADGADITVVAPGTRAPLVFRFRQLVLHPLSRNAKLRVNATLKNPQPVGDLEFEVTFGPFSDQAAQTPISGFYKFRNADLYAFNGIGGKLSSEGKFNGPFNAVEVTGTADVPDFQLDITGHPVHLVNQFHAFVNGTNGEVKLDRVRSHYGKTTILTTGAVAEGAENPSNDVSVDMVSPAGRIQDLLRLFVKEDPPPMTGAIVFRAHVDLPKTDQPFLKRVRLRGDFGITGAQYTKPSTQQKVDILSARSRGLADQVEDAQDKDKKTGGDSVDDDLARVVSNLKGHVELRDGIAHFTNTSFDVPGATALVAGTYDLLTRQIDLRGTVQIQTQLSKATTGVKSFLLKIVQPLTRKNAQKGATLALHVTGTYGHPSFSVTPTAGGK